MRKFSHSSPIAPRNTDAYSVPRDGHEDGSRQLSAGPSSTRGSSDRAAESGLMAAQLVLGTLFLGHCHCCRKANMNPCVHAPTKCAPSLVKARTAGAGEMAYQLKALAVLQKIWVQFPECRCWLTKHL